MQYKSLALSKLNKASINNKIMMYAKDTAAFIKSAISSRKVQLKHCFWLLSIMVCNLFLKIKIEHSSIVYIKGVSLLKLKRFDEAINYFERKAKEDPYKPLLMLGLARVKLCKREYNGCIKLCEQLFTRGVSLKALHICFWQASLSAKNYSEAARYAKKHIQSKGIGVFSSHHILEVARKLNKCKLWHECLKYCNFALSLRDFPDEILHLKGISLAQIGDFKQSEATYLQLIKRNLHYPPGHFGLARSYFRQERYLEAIKKCQYVFSHFSPPSDMYSIMAESLLNEEMYKEAEKFSNDYFENKGLMYNGRILQKCMLKVNLHEHHLLRVLWRIKIKLKDFEAAADIYMDLNRLSQRMSFLKFYGEESLLVPCFDNSITGIYT